MKPYKLQFTSYYGKGREVTFSLTIDAEALRDAVLIGQRMTDVMGWQLIQVAAL